MEKFVCLGGMNVDLKAICYHDFKDDNKSGRIRYKRGGTARNLAEYLKLLKCEVYLISAYGDDDLGKALKEHTMKLGIHLDFSKEFHGGQTTTYIAIHDQNDQFMLSVCDNELVSSLSDFDLETALMNFDEQDYFLIDNNLSFHQMHVVLNKTKKNYFMPIQGKSFIPYLDLLSDFSLILLDEEQLLVCCGFVPKLVSEFIQGSRRLIDRGIKNALMVVEGVALALLAKDALYICTCDAFECLSKSSTNEFLMAAYISVVAEHLPVQKALEFALAAKVLEVSIQNEANHELSVTKIIEKIQEIRPKVIKENLYVSEMC